MRTKLFMLIALGTPLVGIPDSTGSIRLLSCVVSRAGLLEAEVENTSETAQFCNLRCDYTLEGNNSSHWFEISIPARFRGIMGQFDTFRGRPGSYAGHVGSCRSTPRAQGSSISIQPTQ
jgi:hypothetical protein